MTLQEAMQLVSDLSQYYPAREQPAAERALLYAKGLVDLDLDIGREAVAECAAACRFFPSLAELRQSASKRLLSLPPSETLWGTVKRLVGRVGRYRTPSVSCPVLAEAIDATGWLTICDADNETVIRAQFIRTYDAIARQRLLDVQAAPVRDALAAGDRPRLAAIGDKG